MLTADKQAEAILLMEHTKLGHIVLTIECSNGNHIGLVLLEGSQWILDRKLAQVHDLEHNKTYELWRCKSCKITEHIYSIGDPCCEIRYRK